VLRNGRAVGDVIAYLAASDSPLAGRTWRLVLSRYRCDPGPGALPRCAAAASYPGPTRHGRPPVQTSCRTSAGATVTTPTGCHDTLAQELASFGDWTGFYRFADGKPKTFGAGVWLCVSEQIRAAGAWRAPARQLAPTPARACAAASTA
jgi:hypothetical protein